MSDYLYVTDLFVIVTVLHVNYLTESARVWHNGDSYDVHLDDLEQIHDIICQVPTYALMPRDYYLEQSIEEDMKCINSN